MNVSPTTNLRPSGPSANGAAADLPTRGADSGRVVAGVGAAHCIIDNALGHFR